MNEVECPRSGSTDLVERICDAEGLPSLPAVALQIMRMTQDEDASVNKIAEVVGQDPVLTARTLKLVNSSLFGVSRRIMSLPQAIVVLGLRTLKVLTLSLSIVEGLRSRRVDWFDYQSYWRRSLTQAVAAKLLAEAAVPNLRDEAFIGGLLSNLGVLAMSQTIPAEYAAPYRQANGNHMLLLELERTHLGLAHPEVGSRLFEKWDLPENLCVAVALHHGAAGRETCQTDESMLGLIRITSLAAQVADRFCDGATREQLDDLQRAAADSLSLPAPRLEGILHAVDERVKESAVLLSLDIGETTSYKALREQAVLQLAELSVRSELDRAVAQRREVSSRQRVQELRKAALTDALSGLANRAAFDQHIQQAIETCLVSAERLGLILCDLDNFKAINDMYGHQVGDLVIAATGDLLREFEGKNIFAARYGGDEFALILSSCTYETLVDTANRLCDRFHDANVLGPRGPVRFIASIGAGFTDSLAKPSVPDLITLADGCLYMAKTRGRARACVPSCPGQQHTA